MVKVGVLARLKAKAGKEKEVEEFIKGALPLAQAEEGTITWYAIKLSDNEFGIFDSFNDTSGRDAHMSGEIAKALMANASELLSEAPTIEYVDILSAKGAE